MLKGFSKQAQAEVPLGAVSMKIQEGPMSSIQATGQFTDVFRPVMDGVGVAAENLARCMQQQRLGEACVVTPYAPGAEDRFGFRVLRYRSLPLVGRRPYRLGLPGLDRAFLQILAATPFDLVHAHSPFSAGWLARSMAQRRGIPLVASFHTKYREDFASAVRVEPLVRRLVAHVVRFYESADEVWVPSAGAGRTLRDYGFRGRFQIVQYGSDIVVPAGQRQSRAAAANARLGTTPADTVLLYVGQLTRAKNLWFLLESLAALQSRGVEFVAAFVGEGNARADLEARGRLLGLGPRLRFPPPQQNLWVSWEAGSGRWPSP